MIWSDSEGEENIDIPVQTSVAENGFGTSSECNSLLFEESEYVDSSAIPKNRENDEETEEMH
jgi:hypothetical protein